MYFSIYVSTTTRWWSQQALQALLAASRAHNQEAGITGMLLYKEGNFMQVLEGPAAGVQALLARIASDTRHQGLVTLDAGPLAARQFEGWSMGFADLGLDDTPLPPGYSRFLDIPLNDPQFLDQPGHCHQMLQLFRAIT